MPKICRLVAFSDGQRAEKTLPIIWMGTEHTQAEFDSLAQSGADVLLLADCRGVDDLQKCDMGLSVAEARAGRQAGITAIIASVDSAAGLMQLPTWAEKSARLAGIGWNQAAFCADLDCVTDSPIAEHARMQITIAARAFNLPAYDCLDQTEA